MIQLFLVFAVITAVLIVLFAIQNTAVITVSFFAWKFEGPLALALLIAFGLGVIMSLLLSLPNFLRKKTIIHMQKHKIKELEDSTAPPSIYPENTTIDQDNENEKTPENPFTL